MKNNILHFALVLFLVNLIATSLLAGVYFVTRPVIERQTEISRQEALREVMPDSMGDRIVPVEMGKEICYWKVYKGLSNEPTGYIFTAKRYGYSSTIETMVGMSKDGIITGVKILSQNETPGLGARIVEVLSNRNILSAIKDLFSKNKTQHTLISKPYFTEQFKGRDIKDLSLSGIDAITGATISSRAVVDSIKEKGMEILNVRE